MRGARCRALRLRFVFEQGEAPNKTNHQTRRRSTWRRVKKAWAAYLSRSVRGRRRGQLKVPAGWLASFRRGVINEPERNRARGLR